MKLNSVRFKISILYTAILGVIFAVYSFALHLTLQRSLYQEFDRNLRLKTQAVLNTVNFYLDILGYDEQTLIFALNRITGKAVTHPYQRMTESLEIPWLRNLDDFGIKKDGIVLLSAQGDILLKPAGLEPEDIKRVNMSQPRLKGRRSMFTNTRMGTDLRRVYTLVYSYRGREMYILQVWTSVQPVERLLELRLHYRLIFIPFILLVGFFVGGAFAGRILRPVEEITNTAKRIASGDLSVRVKTAHMDSEMQNLVEAFNNMISRLEQSFKYIAEFGSHVAHELKTPLAIIRGETEIALRKRRQCDEYERVLSIAVEESQRMLKIIEGLLLLTRLDYLPDAFKFEPVEINAFLKDLYTESSVLAQEKNVAMSFKPCEIPLTVNADKLHLRRVFLNLIDNALKYTPEKGSIDLAVRRDGSTVVVSVSDTGIGIHEKDLPKIFTKFYRSAKGNPFLSGVGLGLSIVQTIVKMHNGIIEVRSTPSRGTTFTIFLPLSVKASA